MEWECKLWKGLDIILNNQNQRIMTIPGLHFQPNVGPNYQVGSGLAAFAESHYFDDWPTEEDDFSAGYDDFTIKTVRDGFLARAEGFTTPFFRNAGLLFCPQDCYKIWHNIAFANLIQIGLPTAKSQPDAREIQTIGPAFQLLLDSLQPAKLLVLSRRLYEYWIPETNGKAVCPISANGKHSTVWQYRHAGGSCLTMGVIHPSRMYGKATAAWKPLVDAFLAM